MLRNSSTPQGCFDQHQFTRIFRRQQTDETPSHGINHWQSMARSRAQRFESFTEPEVRRNLDVTDLHDRSRRVAGSVFRKSTDELVTIQHPAEVAIFIHHRKILLSACQQQIHGIAQNRIRWQRTKVREHRITHGQSLRFFPLGHSCGLLPSRHENEEGDE